MKTKQAPAKRRVLTAQQKTEAKERLGQRVAKALEEFDRKPAAASVGAPVVAALCGCTVSTVWERARRNPSFPKPRKIGGRTLWNVGELRQLLQGKLA